MPETSARVTPRCTRCGSDAMIPDAFIYPEGIGVAALSAGVYTKPDALMMKGPVRTELRVSICGDCGFVEVEVADARKLWDAYVDRLSRELG